MKKKDKVAKQMERWYESPSLEAVEVENPTEYLVTVHKNGIERRRKKECEDGTGYFPTKLEAFIHHLTYLDSRVKESIQRLEHWTEKTEKYKELITKEDMS